MCCLTSPCYTVEPCEQTWESYTTDETGMPSDFKARQELGFIRFSWVDQSLCEESFSLSRNGERFISDYTNAARDACQARHNPPNHFDNLAMIEPAVAVGDSITYCLAATSILGVGTEGYKSNEACLTLTVGWETKLTVTVESEEGGHPIEDVRLTWYLIPKVSVKSVTSPSDAVAEATATGTQSTNAEGTAIIHVLSNDSRMNRQTDAAIYLVFSKVSGGRSHTFKCDSLLGQECSSTSVLVMTGKFDETFSLFDTSTMPFSGKISVPNVKPIPTVDSDTNGEGIVWPSSYNERSSCPIASAEICAYDFDKKARLVCVKSNNAGEYSLPLPIGARVQIDVAYLGHSAWQRVAGPTSGVSITRSNSILPSSYDEPDTEVFEIADVGDDPSPWRGMDYEDRQTRIMTLDVYGTRCQKPLGLSIFEFAYVPAPDLCKTNFQVGTGVTSQRFAVPAHLYDVTLKTVNQDDGELRSDIVTYFENLGTKTQRLNVTVEDDTLAFKFMPLPTLSLMLAGAIIPSCDEPIDWTSDTGELEAPDPQPDVIVRTGGQYIARITAAQDSGNNQGPCDHVEGDVNLHSLLGLSADEEADAATDDKVLRRSIGENYNLTALTMCRDFGACQLRLEHDQVVRYLFFPKSLQCPQGDDSVQQVLSKDDCQKAVAGRFNASLFENNGKIQVNNVANDDTASPYGCFVLAVRRNGTESLQAWFNGNPPDASSDSIEDKAPYTMVCRKTRLINAHTQLALQVGLVRLDPTYLRELSVSMTVEGHVGIARTTLLAAVTGLRFISDKFTAALPEYMPLLVLHDPPGGGSSASYENVRTTFTVNLESVSSTAQGQLSTLVFAGTEAEAETAGGTVTGVGAAVSFATKFKLLGAEFHAGVEHSKAWANGEFEERERAAEFGVTISYSTSDGAENAGMLSDVFVLPTLTVLFSLSSYVTFDAKQCIVNRRQVTAWYLLKDKSGFSVITHKDIQSSALPTVARLEAAEAKKAVPGYVYAPGEDRYDADKHDELIQAKKHWEQILKENTDLHALAHTSNHNLTRATGLVPTSLAANAHDFNGNQVSVQDAVRLLNYNVLKFYGGGESMSFSTSNALSSTDTEGTSSSEEQYIGAVADAKIAVTVVVIGSEFSAGAGAVAEDSKSTSTGLSESTSIGFTLADPDAGDQFDVEILKDPRYNTFLFRTIGGISTCEHEANTVKRINLATQLIRAPTAAVPPDEPAIFELEISNEAETNGFDLSQQTIFLELEGLSLTHGIQVSIDGEPLVDQIVIREFPDVGRLVVLVEVRRGPIHYEYGALRFHARQACDGGDTSEWTELATHPNSEAESKIQFLRPCSLVDWAGLLRSEGKFVVSTLENADGTVLVGAVNPHVGTRRWLAPCSAFPIHSRIEGEPSLTCPLGRCELDNGSCKGSNWEYDERLEWVRLQFRLQGLVGVDSWKFASDEKGNILDFAAAEKPFGSAQQEWQTPLQDGVYEIRLKAQCVPTGNPEYDEVTSSILTGVIDRQAPQLFRRFTEPADGECVPGDEISATFSEAINCGPTNTDLAVRMTDGATTFSLAARTLLVACSDRTLYVSLPPDATYEFLQLKQFKIFVSGVQDLHGNLRSSTAVWSFVIGKRQVSQLLLSTLQGVHISSPIEKINVTAFAASAISLFAGSLGYPTSVFEIVNIRALTGPSLNATTFDVEVRAYQDQSAYDIAQKVSSFLASLLRSRTRRAECEPLCDLATAPEPAEELIDPETTPVTDECSDTTKDIVSWAILGTTVLILLLQISYMCRSARQRRYLFPDQVPSTRDYSTKSLQRTQSSFLDTNV
eukprot:m.129078 g.129078  ORF g.129078 m.129078 type:complete len:1807 (+) comp9763_c0_seq2:474-5894(+)